MCAYHVGQSGPEAWLIFHKALWTRRNAIALEQLSGEYEGETPTWLVADPPAVPALEPPSRRPRGAWLHHRGRARPPAAPTVFGDGELMRPAGLPNCAPAQRGA